MFNLDWLSPPSNQTVVHSEESVQTCINISQKHVTFHKLSTFEFDRGLPISNVMQ